MFLWFIGVVIIVLVVMADVHYMRSRKIPWPQALRQRRKKSKKTASAGAPQAAPVKPPRVYDSFGELLEALNSQEPKRLFVLAEDEALPNPYGQPER
jgi:hypothetical protein